MAREASDRPKPLSPAVILFGCSRATLYVMLMHRTKKEALLHCKPSKHP